MADTLIDLFDFNQSFRLHIEQIGSEDVWTQIDQLLVEYLRNKRYDSLLAIEFMFDYLKSLECDTTRTGFEKRCKEILQRLWQASAHPHLDNRWLLLRIWRNLLPDAPELDRMNKPELELQLALKQNGHLPDWLPTSNLDQPPVIETVIEKLRRLIDENLDLSQILLNRIKQILRNRKQSNYRLEHFSLVYLKQLLSKDNQHGTDQTIPSNFTLICDLLAINSDKHLLDVKFEPYLYNLAAKCDAIETHKLPHLLQRYYTSLLARDTMQLARLACATRWQIEKDRHTASNAFLLINPNTGLLNTLNCARLALLDQQHFIIYILQLDLSCFTSVPVCFRLPFVIHHSYRIAQTDDKGTFQAGYSKLKQILTKTWSKEDTLHYERIDPAFVNVITRLKWIFSFLTWCFAKVGSFSAIERQKVFADLLRDRSFVEVLKKHDLICRVLSKEDKEFHEMLNAARDSQDEGSLMLWRAYSCLCLVFEWILNTHVTCDRPNSTGNSSESPSPTQVNDSAGLDKSFFISSITELLRQIQPINFRVEILENCFSLLFLNENDFRDDLTEEFKVTELVTEHEMTATEMSEIDKSDSEDDVSVSSKDTLNVTQDVRILFGGSPILKRMLNRTHKSQLSNHSVFFHTIDTFIFPNSCVLDFIRLLKEQVVETRSELFALISHTDEDHVLYETKNEYFIKCSIPNLYECRNRSKDLLDYINAAEWRYSVVSPAFIDHPHNQASSSPGRPPPSLDELDGNLHPDTGSSIVAVAQAMPLSTQRPRTSTTGSNWFYRNFRTISLSGSCDSLTDRFEQEPNSAADSRTPEGAPHSHVLHSIVSCMLASFDQLLRYCLIENQLEKAQQVLKLFECELQGSIEAVELVVISKCEQLSNEIRHLQSNESSRLSVSKSDPLFKTRLQSILHNFMHEMESVQQGFDCRRLLNDFAICSAPNLEIARMILDINRHNASAEPHSNELLVDFVQQCTKSVEVYHKCVDLQQLSLYNALLCTWSNQDLDQPDKAVADLELDLRFRKTLNRLQRLLDVELQAISQDSDFIQNPHNRSTRNSASPACAAVIDSRSLLNEYQQLMRFCATGKFDYLRALFTYVRRVSRALDDCYKRNESASPKSPVSPVSAAKSTYDSFIMRSDSFSFFTILYKSPSAILYSLVVDQGIAPQLVDDLAKQMKVQLLSTLCKDLLPPIAASPAQDELFAEFCVEAHSHPHLCRLITAHLTSSTVCTLIVDEHSEDDDDLHVEIANQTFRSESEHPQNSEHRVKWEILQTTELIEYFKMKSNLIVITLKLMNLIDLDAITPDNLDLDFIPDSPLMKWINLVQQWFGNPSGIFKRDLTILAMFPCLPASNSTVLRYMEKLACARNYDQMYRTLNRLYMPSPQSSSGFMSFRTALLHWLGVQTGDIKYALQIESPATRAQLILDIINRSGSLYSNSILAVEDLTSLLFSMDQSIFLNSRSYTKEQLERIVEQNESELMHIRRQIEIAIRKVKAYRRIAELAGLRTWKDAIENLEEIDILMILKTRKQYELAIEWNEIEKQLRMQQSESEYLQKVTITEQEVDIQEEVLEFRRELLTVAFCVLQDTHRLRSLYDSLPESRTVLLQTLEKVYPSIESLEGQTFAAQTIVELKDETALLSNIEMYRNNLIGLQLMAFLDPSLRIHYQHLVAQPRLFIEQMFMNGEFDALDQCVRMPRLIRSLDQSSFRPEAGNRRTKDHWTWDSLIEWHAGKAVEFQTPSDQTSVASSDVNFLSTLNPLDSAPMPIFDEKYVMPAQPPARDQWIPDRQIAFCMACKVNRFSAFHRKHHCRRCGRVVCKACSTHRLILSQSKSSNLVRVCDQCYQQTISSSVQESLDLNVLNRHNPTQQGPQWQLSATCDVDNDMIRDEFYYEAAPSGSFCLRILRFHSKPLRCLNVILEQLCDPLFELLASIDIDFGLVIGVIKSLLTSAQTMITERHVGNDEMLCKINFLLDRLDIVKMLVDDHCIDADLIRMVILKEPQNIGLQQLQDRLIELERFELALRVAAKLNRNSNRVWQLWAFLCLKHGKFPEARAKFRYCFKEKSTNDSSTHNSKLLKEIMDCLDNHKLRYNHTSLRDRCQLIKSGQASTLFTRSALESSALPDILRLEAEYYLQTYGIKDDWLRFYAKFKMYANAIELLCRETPTASLTSMFIHELIVPALQYGQLDRVLKHMSHIDPGCEQMYKHLINLCKYLNAQHFYSILHQIQLFMADYVRAAMTKVNHFFLQPAPSDYIQLFHRLENLRQARKHCVTYLDQNQKLGKGCLQWSADEVSRLIRTLDLQIELTERFYENDVSGLLPFSISAETTDANTPNEIISSFDNLLSEHVAESERNTTKALQKIDLMEEESEGELNEWILENEYDKIEPDQPETKDCNKKRIPFTLLSSLKSDRTSLAALLIFYAGTSTNEGFAFASKIMQEYDLEVEQVLRVAVKILIHSKKVNIVKILIEILDCLRNYKTIGNLNVSDLNDELVKICIAQTTNVVTAESMIKLLHSDVHKIDSYMLIGKLKQAYLMAVKLNRVDDVLRIRAAAQESGQDAIQRICDMWLNNRKVPFASNEKVT